MYTMSQCCETLTDIFTSTVIPLEIWDCPGNITVEDLGVPLSDFSSLIFVIDIRVGFLCVYIAWIPLIYSP